jgi:hypothetical protein
MLVIGASVSLYCHLLISLNLYDVGLLHDLTLHPFDALFLRLKPDCQCTTRFLYACTFH